MYNDDDDDDTSSVDLQEMAGTVGPPLPGTDMRLEAVPEMNYDPSGTPPRGEILFRGANVFSGYYREPEKTQEVHHLQRHSSCIMIKPASSRHCKARQAPDAAPLSPSGVDCTVGQGSGRGTSQHLRVNCTVVTRL